MDWKEKLCGEVEEDIDAIREMDIGSKEFIESVPKVNDMIDRINEAEKIEVEKDKLKVDKMDRVIKYVVTGVTFLGAAFITIWGTIYSDNFDVDRIHDNEAGKFHIKNWLGFMKGK